MFVAEGRVAPPMHPHRADRLVAQVRDQVTRGFSMVVCKNLLLVIRHVSPEMHFFDVYLVAHLLRESLLFIGLCELDCRFHGRVLETFLAVGSQQRSTSIISRCSHVAWGECHAHAVLPYSLAFLYYVEQNEVPTYYLLIDQRT
jgi:hypothetical protein